MSKRPNLRVARCQPNLPTNLPFTTHTAGKEIHRSNHRTPPPLFQQTTTDHHQSPATAMSRSGSSVSSNRGRRRGVSMKTTAVVELWVKGRSHRILCTSLRRHLRKLSSARRSSTKSPRTNRFNTSQLHFLRYRQR